MGEEKNDGKEMAVFGEILHNKEQSLKSKINGRINLLRERLQDASEMGHSVEVRSLRERISMLSQHIIVVKIGCEKAEV